MTKKITELSTKSSAAGTDVLAGVDMTANTTKQFPVSGLPAGFSSKSITLTQVNGGSTAGMLATDASGNVTSTTVGSLGYVEKTTSYSNSTSTTDLDVTSMSVTVTVPTTTRRLRIIASGTDYEQTGGIGTHYGVIKIKESTTVLNTTNVTPGTANLAYGWTVIAYVASPSAGSHTYKLSVANNSTGPNFTLGASASAPMTMSVELI